MTIDAYNLIKPLLVFDSDDDFYHLQVLKRKKENPELGSNSLVLKTYYINSLEYLNMKYPEIKSMCEFSNARAMINLNRRSFEKIAFQTLRKVSEQIFNKDFRSVRKSYETVCGAYGNEKNKKWIIDIDNFDKSYDREVQDYINNIQPIGGKLYVNLPTRNGHHLITKPFRLDLFKQKFPELDVHKDNPCNIYIP
jgi:hypothetical protein